ncbi:Apc15p protein-domain-containing protein [Massariosphaeria phaeospora]|uniref:Apc15p protein-domain-containing protein n=1 Tax=Massariosphaeria phaeospora TaxID=100035 RepID=A0A7C8MJF8_9PLEO|nr:Apc15p protein-domain-containing protein [Massariosphaeria phaeospora]
MLSLPFIIPRADGSLWPSHRLRDTYLDAPSNDPQTSAAHNTHQGHSSHHNHHTNPSRSFLAALTTDENVIDQRKQNVRRFGAGWIRPPGVAKTYQATMDEAAEREEQEILARREQVMLDLQAAQQDAANAEAREQGEDEEMEDERDLDDEVPEAEADDSDVSASDVSGSEVEEGDTSALGAHPGDMTFNEDSFLEGSMVHAEVEHMLEMEEAELAGVLQDERDLDDDVPEAGSYEHTDSELEESDSEADASFALPGSAATRRAARRSSARLSGGLQQRVQGSRNSVGFEGSSSIMEGSSFLRSSPAAVRGNLRAQFMGARGRTGV